MNDDGRLGRMPVWGKGSSVDPIRRHWLTWLLVINALWCAVNLLGWVVFVSPLLSTTGTALLILSTVLVAFGWSIAGAGVGLFAWSAFAFASPPPFWGAIVLSVGMVGFNALVLAEVGTGLDNEREEKQRRD